VGVLERVLMGSCWFALLGSAVAMLLLLQVRGQRL